MPYYVHISDSEDHSEKGNDSETETNVFRENETTNQMDSQESTNSETELGGLALPIEGMFNMYCINICFELFALTNS